MEMWHAESAVSTRGNAASAGEAGQGLKVILLSTFRGFKAAAVITAKAKLCLVELKTVLQESSFVLAFNNKVLLKRDVKW